MKKIFYLFIAGSFVLGTTQCKDKDNETSPITSGNNGNNNSTDKAELISGSTMKSYKVTALNWGGVDFLATAEACEKDNLFHFYKDGKYYQLAGADDCDGEEADTLEAGNWSLNKAQDSIFVTGKDVDGDFELNLKIESISASSVSVSNNDFGLLKTTFTAQ